MLPSANCRYGNWSSYADATNHSFWRTRFSEPLQPADKSYSSVDWIIKACSTYVAVLSEAE